VRQLACEAVEGRRLNVTEIAERCSVSRRHLMREWKAATGTTLHGYIAELRLERAKALLKSTSLKLKEVSAELGFADPSHFAADFKRHVGCSPSRYRTRTRDQLAA
jgi:AraC-like DNA-binding protein